MRRAPREHLIDEHPHRPPVDRLPMPLRLNNLGREVLGRTAQRPRPILNLLRKAKVGHLDVARLVDEQVLGFEVPVDYARAAVLVQVLEPQPNLRRVESPVLVLELAGLPWVRKQFAADNKLQKHV